MKLGALLKSAAPADPIAQAKARRHATAARLDALRIEVAENPSEAGAAKLAAAEAELRAHDAAVARLEKAADEARAVAFVSECERMEAELSAVRAKRESETRAAILNLLRAAAAFARFDRAGDPDYGLLDALGVARLAIRRCVGLVGWEADRREAIEAEATKFFKTALAGPLPVDPVAALEDRLSELKQKGPDA